MESIRLPLSVSRVTRHAGDWALYRGGAVFIEGAENITVQENVFKRVDGNALFLSGYTRGVQVLDNDFSWIGDCSMATWGYSKDNDYDGTDGELPRHTLIKGNYARELGIFQLQSSMLFMAKTALTTVDSNIFFNGPRSGINFNGAVPCCLFACTYLSL